MNQPLTGIVCLNAALFHARIGSAPFKAYAHITPVHKWRWVFCDSVDPETKMKQSNNFRLPSELDDKAHQVVVDAYVAELRRLQTL